MSTYQVQRGTKLNGKPGWVVVDTRTNARSGAYHHRCDAERDAGKLNTILFREQHPEYFKAVAR